MLFKENRISSYRLFVCLFPQDEAQMSCTCMISSVAEECVIFQEGIIWVYGDMIALNTKIQQHLHIQTFIVCECLSLRLQRQKG